MFWGLIFQVQVLKVRVINVGFKPFAPRGEALVLELPPEYGWSCWGWNLRWHCVPVSPTGFDAGLFSFTDVLVFASNKPTLFLIPPHGIAFQGFTPEFFPFPGIFDQCLFIDSFFVKILLLYIHMLRKEGREDPFLERAVLFGYFIN